jgi:hypothetical protein
MRLFKVWLLTILALGFTQVLFASTATWDHGTRGISYPGVYSDGQDRTGEEILVARDYLPWGGDVVGYLTAAGAVVTVITTADIMTVPLEEYCLLFIECGTSDPGSPTESNVNAALPIIEAYLHTGGDVLYYTGTWGATYAFPGGGVSVYEYQNENYFCISGHPIAAGVPDPFLGNYASHDYFVGLPGNAYCIMTDPMQNWTAAEYDFGQGHVVLMSQPVECYIAGGYCGNATYPHFETLLDNSTQYATRCDTDFVLADGNPSTIALAQNYPNPFNPSTQINFSLEETSYTSLRVFDLSGQTVAVLVDRLVEGGNHSVTFDASNLASGVYFYRLEADNQLRTQRMVIMK